MSVRCSLLTYDIPEKSGVPNPSKQLRRRAVRVNLSCWVVPDDRMPHHLLESWDLTGVVYRVVPFDPAAADKLQQLARDAISETVRMLTDKLTKRVGKADQIGNVDEQTTYLKRLEVARKSALRHLEDLQAAMPGFGIGDMGGSLLSARVQIEQLTSAARARASIYTTMAALAAHSAMPQQMAAAACADELPDYALVDLLEDAGEDNRPLLAGLDQG